MTRSPAPNTDLAASVAPALHPVSVGAVAILLVNDWWLKPSRHATWLAGKLSDLCGLVAAPLVLAAGFGLLLVLARRVGVRVEPACTRTRLNVCIGLTGAVFVAVKLSPTLAGVLVDAWSRVFAGARIVSDPSDLLALPGLAIAWRVGESELRRRRSSGETL